MRPAGAIVLADLLNRLCLNGPAKGMVFSNEARFVYVSKSHAI